MITISTGNYLFTEASSPGQDGKKAWLSSHPCRCIWFWYHMSGDSSTESLKVYIVRKFEKRALVWSKAGDQGNQWNNAKLTVYIRLQIVFCLILGMKTDHLKF